MPRQSFSLVIVFVLSFTVLYSANDVDVHQEYSKGHQLFVARKFAEAEEQWTKMIQWLPTLEVVRTLDTCLNIEIRHYLTSFAILLSPLRLLSELPACQCIYLFSFPLNTFSHLCTALDELGYYLGDSGQVRRSH